MLTVTGAAEPAGRSPTTSLRIALRVRGREFGPDLAPVVRAQLLTCRDSLFFANRGKADELVVWDRAGTPRDDRGRLDAEQLRYDRWPAQLVDQFT
jgi:hypothetical protein